MFLDFPDHSLKRDCQQLQHCDAQAANLGAGDHESCLPCNHCVKSVFYKGADLPRSCRP